MLYEWRAFSRHEGVSREEGPVPSEAPEKAVPDPPRASRSVIPRRVRAGPKNAGSGPCHAQTATAGA